MLKPFSVRQLLAGVDTINTTVNGKNVVVAAEAKEDVCLGGINNFKFYITKLDGAYSVRPVDQPTKYLYALNGKLGFTTDTSKALPVTVGEGNPTSNESIDNAVFFYRSNRQRRFRNDPRRSRRDGLCSQLIGYAVGRDSCHFR